MVIFGFFGFKKCNFWVSVSWFLKNLSFTGTLGSSGQLGFSGRFDSDNGLSELCVWTEKNKMSTTLILLLFFFHLLFLLSTSFGKLCLCLYIHCFLFYSLFCCYARFNILNYKCMCHGVCINELTKGQEVTGV